MPKKVKDCSFKILMVGDSQVGKSSLLSRFTTNEFSHHQMPTIGVDFGKIQKQIGDHVINTVIWDPSGQERFSGVTLQYYRHKRGVLFVYDVSCLQSFQNIESWLEKVESSSTDDVPFVLVGNKLDLAKKGRAVSTKEAAKYAYDNNMLYFETSALDTTGVEDAFMTLVTRIFEDMLKPKNQEKPQDLVSAQAIIEQLVLKKKELEEKVDSLEIYKKKYEEQELEIKQLKQQLARRKQMEKLNQNGTSEKNNRKVFNMTGSLSTNDHPENDICYDDPEEKTVE